MSRPGARYKDEAACQIVLGDAKLICHGQVWSALGVAVPPQRAGAGLAITQIPRNLPGPRLGAAVQSSCCKDCVLELLPD